MKDNSGPAFPCNSPDGMESYKGMSLRDYFAGQALAGLASLVPPDIDSCVYYAYTYADAMLAEREKNK